MIFFKLLPILLIVLLVVFFVTQIIKPGLNNTARFPYFRKQGSLQAEEISLNQKDIERELQSKLDKRKQESIEEDKKSSS